MWFAYLDEAGNTGRNLDDPDQPIHLVATVMVEESRVMDAHERIREIGRSRCRRGYRRPNFEFHGSAIFGGTGHFADQTPVERVEVYRELLGTLCQVDAQVVVTGVSKPHLKARYSTPFHPHDIALKFTLESIERFARSQGSRVLVVADQAREVEDAAIRDLVSYQEFGTGWGWNAESIDHIIDSIHFVRSETNPLIQLADCVTFVEGRRRKADAGIVKPSTEIDSLWERFIEPALVESKVWYPTQ